MPWAPRAMNASLVGRLAGPSVRDLVYTNLGGQPQRLDVYLPAGRPPSGGWPVVLAIHGGGWRRLDKANYGARVASAFVPQGFAVVAPNYVLSSPGNPSWPLNFQDIQAAARWIQAQSPGFGFDPSRVVAMGESAGAHLAELLGASGTGRPAASVSAVVGFSGPSDLGSLVGESRGAGSAVQQMLGGPPGALPAAYGAASPVDQVGPSAPPMLLIHGAADTLVPALQSMEMSAALAAAGVPHALILLPGLGHELNFPNGTPSDLVAQILEFLDAAWHS